MELYAELANRINSEYDHIQLCLFIGVISRGMDVRTPTFWSGGRTSLVISLVICLTAESTTDACDHYLSAPPPTHTLCRRTSYNSSCLFASLWSNGCYIYIWLYKAAASVYVCVCLSSRFLKKRADRFTWNFSSFIGVIGIDVNG